MLVVMELSTRLWEIIVQSRQGKPRCKCWANDKGSRQSEKEHRRPGRRLGLDGDGLLLVPLEQCGEGEQASSRVQQKQRWGWGGM